MEWLHLLYKSLPVFWWIAIWGLTETAIGYLVSHKKEWRTIFYIGMIAIILGILYFDDYAIDSF